MPASDADLAITELEADGAEASLLDYFDRDSGQWRLPKEGKFWDAIKAAHAAGNTGRGKTIAIIDAGFDLSIVRLSEQAQSVPIQNQAPSKPTDHGTLVALLTLEVAPEAQLELYEVTGSDGRIDSRLLMKALDLLKTSPALIVNLSMGNAQHLTQKELIELQAGLGSTEDDFRLSKEELRPRTDHECQLCAAADAVAKTGKLFVAAAGNKVDAIYCPARSSNVIASGFSVEELHIAEDGGELANSVISGEFSHSQFTDFTIKQVPGALGTSYSAPLLTGFLALETEPDKLSAFFVAQRKAATAAFFYRIARESNDNSALDMAVNAFNEALELLPHRHEKDGSSAACAECILFSEDIYVNYGLALASKGDLERSAVLWEAAAKFAPDSPHAYANLGWLKYRTARELLSEDTPANADQALILLNEAALLYSHAISIRPLFEGYVDTYKEIANLEHHIRFAIVERLRLLHLLKLYFNAQTSLERVNQAMDILRSFGPWAVTADERREVCRFLQELSQSSNDIERKIGEKFNLQEFLNIWKE